MYVCNNIYCLWGVVPKRADSSGSGPQNLQVLVIYLFLDL